MTRLAASWPDQDFNGLEEDYPLDPEIITRDWPPDIIGSIDDEVIEAALETERGSSPTSQSAVHHPRLNPKMSAVWRKATFDGILYTYLERLERKYVCSAYNASRYDARLLLQPLTMHLYEVNRGSRPITVHKRLGGISLLKDNKTQVEFRDSLSLLGAVKTSLDTLAKSMGVHSDLGLAKYPFCHGFAPHLSVSEFLALPALPETVEEWNRGNLGGRSFTEADIKEAHRLFHKHKCKSIRDYIVSQKTFLKLG